MQDWKTQVISCISYVHPMYVYTVDGKIYTYLYTEEVPSLQMPHVTAELTSSQG